MQLQLLSTKMMMTNQSRNIVSMEKHIYKVILHSTSYLDVYSRQ